MNGKKLGVIIVLIIGALVVGAVLVGSKASDENSTLELEAQRQVIEDITPKQARALIQDYKEHEDFIILDLRCIKEYTVGHIDKAINLNYFAKSFPEEFNKLDRNKTYLIYCRTGKISKAILEEMKIRGFREVYNISGGISQWEAQGLPTTKK